MPATNLRDLDVSIIQKIYKFYLALHIRVMLFRKFDRYTLGKKCEEVTLQILEQLFNANAEFDQNKLNALNKINVNLKILKTTIRLCHDTGALDLKNYVVLEDHLQEFGRMLGGWIGYLKNKNPPGQ